MCCEQIGISSVWWEGNPCNMHLNDLAAEVKEGVHEVGMIGLRFNTIGVSDAISMGTDGMWWVSLCSAVNTAIQGVHACIACNQ